MDLTIPAMADGKLTKTDRRAKVPGQQACAVSTRSDDGEGRSEISGKSCSLKLGFEGPPLPRSRPPQARIHWIGLV
jgi:hypothetical protein